MTVVTVVKVVSEVRVVTGVTVVTVIAIGTIVTVLTVLSELTLVTAVSTWKMCHHRSHLCPFLGDAWVSRPLLKETGNVFCCGLSVCLSWVRSGSTLV